MKRDFRMYIDKNVFYWQSFTQQSPEPSIIIPLETKVAKAPISLLQCKLNIKEINRLKEV